MCVDRERFDHYIATDFEFASSPLDVSVINPFAGMGGLSQPWAVWLNPVYLLPHILPPIRQWDTLPSTREWAWGYLVAIFFMAAGAYCLARAVGLPYYLRVIAAQVLGICFFSPVGYWTFARGIGANFGEVGHNVFMVASFGAFFLAVFMDLGRSSYRGNLARVVLLPILLVYIALCDLIYAGMLAFLPLVFFLPAVYFTSGSRQVFKWRTIGAVACLVVALAVNIPGLDSAFASYVNRFAFPNEIHYLKHEWAAGGACSWGAWPRPGSCSWRLAG